MRSNSLPTALATTLLLAAAPGAWSQLLGIPEASMTPANLHADYRYQASWVRWAFQPDEGAEAVGHRSFDPYLDTAPMGNFGVGKSGDDIGPKDVARKGQCYGFALETLRHFHFGATGAIDNGDQRMRLRTFLENKGEAVADQFLMRVKHASSDQGAFFARVSAGAELAGLSQNLGPKGEEKAGDIINLQRSYEDARELRDSLLADLENPRRGMTPIGFRVFGADVAKLGGHAVLVYEAVRGTAVRGSTRYPATAFRFYDSNFPLATPDEVTEQEAANLLLAIETPEGVRVSFGGGYLDRYAPQLVLQRALMVDLWDVDRDEVVKTRIHDDGAFMQPGTVTISDVYTQRFQRWVEEARQDHVIHREPNGNVEQLRSRPARRGFSD